MSTKACYRFSSNGFCQFGDRCHFRHDISERRLDTQTTVIQAARAAIDLTNLLPEEMSELRDSELSNIGKRFVDCEQPKEGSFKFNFKSTDPEWPYDVAVINLLVSLPETYPLKVMSVHVSESDDIPITISESIQDGIDGYLKERQDVIDETKHAILMFRPFLRWLDRNLEEFFTRGLRKLKTQLELQASKIEVIKNKGVEIPNSSADKEESLNSDEDIVTKQPIQYMKDRDDIEEVRATLEKYKILNCESASSDSDENTKDFQPQADISQNVGAGTEARLLGLKLSSNVSTIICTYVSATVSCNRCHNIQTVGVQSCIGHSIVCSKCSSSFSLNFRPRFIHSASSVLGHFDLVDCKTKDFLSLTSKYDVVCFECQQNNSTQGIANGQHKVMFCNKCNSKIQIFFESIRLVRLTQSVAFDIRRISKKAQREKDPLIIPGQPLPKKGSCKHFGKSRRWFRFNCCGKLYPCEDCHNLVETHEMERAKRIVCGYCSKEQAIHPSNACCSCGAEFVKSKSSHWEGGQGCRNKITMSRNDSAKYRNSNKTVPAKRVGKKE